MDTVSSKNRFKLSNIAIALIATMPSASFVIAQDQSANNVVEVIQSDDIGKLPDPNLAEVLENVTGIQITRTAGVGTAFQIRGTDENRVEINGVSTVGSASGRDGISFEDLPAALISAVEVTKAPEAKTIEGSVGGTINLRTLRPLELNDTVFAVRGKLQNSDLDVNDNYTPILSGTYGDNWQTDNGEFSVVVSMSYAEQKAFQLSAQERTEMDLLQLIKITMLTVEPEKLLTE
jgi:TonB-dependent receptor